MKKVEDRHRVNNRIEAFFHLLVDMCEFCMCRRGEKEEGRKPKETKGQEEGWGGAVGEEREPNQTCLGVVSGYCVKRHPLKPRNYNPT